MPRSVVHVLLSLLLLITQQMSLLHIATHFEDVRTPHGPRLAQQAETGSAAKPGKPALHELCALCLDGAQLAFSLPAPKHFFIPLELAYDSPSGPHSAGVDPQTIYVFQPRGPPQA